MNNVHRIPSDIAIIDFGMGNLYSVRRACEMVGLKACITTDWRVAQHAKAVILPGVGAFGDAMATLRQLEMDVFLRDYVNSDKLLVGICLGIQLLMTESYEFGVHRGLNIIEGTVTRFDDIQANGSAIKVPHIGWNQIYPVRRADTDTRSGDIRNAQWDGTGLDGIQPGEYFYFVHSFYICPVHSEVILSETRYGDTTFCSTLQYKNIFACQYHPERSGPYGLQIYANIAKHIGVTAALS